MEKIMTSVCIATYNGEKFIKQQIETILNQTYEIDEIIISDDNSTDKTLKILSEFKNNKIKIIKNNKKGVVSNFENALKNCFGEIIFLCDQDDIWVNTKVEVLIKKMKSYDIINHNAIIYFEKNNYTLDKTFFQLRNSKSGFLRNLYKTRYLGCCMVFNRKILEKALPFPDGIEMHDWWLGLIGESYGKSLFLDENLIFYRRHESNVSRGFEKSNYSKLKQLSIRCNFLKNIILRVLGVK